MDKVNKKRFTTYVRVDTLLQLQELSSITGIPLSTLVQEGIEDMLSKWNGKLSVFKK